VPIRFHFRAQGALLVAPQAVAGYFAGNGAAAMNEAKSGSAVAAFRFA
jgi:hypothetical protein